MPPRIKLHEVIAHMNGIGDLVCHPSGEHVYTCGSDTAIRIFNTDLNLLTSIEHQHSAAIRSLTINNDGNSLISAGEDHNIQLFNIQEDSTGSTSISSSSSSSSSSPVPKLKFDSTVHRLGGSVNCVSFHNSGNSVAVGGDEKNIKIISLLDNSSIITLAGHPTSVRYLCYSPSGTYLASIDSLGTLHINEPFEKKNLLMENIMQRIDMEQSQQMAKLAWSHDSELLALPGKSEIRVISATSGFKDTHLVLKAGHSAATSVLAFSPNSLYLASTGADMKIIIWEMNTGEILTETVTEAHCVAMSWCINSNGIIMLDDQGYIKKWKDPIPNHLPSPFTIDEAESHLAYKKSIQQDNAVDTSQLDPIGDINEDDDEEAAVGAGREGEEEGQQRKRLRKAAETNGNANARRRGGSSSGGGELMEGLPDDFDDDDDMDDFIVDDTNGQWKDNDDDYLSRKARESLTTNPHTQPAFQPSSTPSDPITKRRYLCWNLIGSIVTMNNEVFHSIEIIFNDTNKHKAIRLRDHYGFNVAALGEYGCLMASQYENSQRPSVLFFRAFNSWAANSDWTLHLPAPENCLCVAVGTKFAAAATDKQYVRINSFSGMQLTIFSMKGPVVSMIAHQHLLAIVYHSGMPLSAHQSMQVVIMDVDRRKSIANVPVALSPGATLSWLHFTDNGMLMTMDSNSVFRVLSRQWDLQWVPIVDINNIKKQNKNDVYWPVGLLEDQLMCAVCKGGIKVPSTINRPVLTAVSLSIPFVPTDFSAVEEQHSRSGMMLYESNYHRHITDGLYNHPHATPFVQHPTPKESARLDALLLPLVQLCCKQDQSVKALDLCSSLQLMKSLEMMGKLANENKKINLAGRIGLLMGAKEREKQKEKERLTFGVEQQGKMSIDTFVEKGEKRAIEERKRRAAALAAEEAEFNRFNATAQSKSKKKELMNTAAEEEKDEVDEGETELTYSKKGKKRVRTVEKSDLQREKEERIKEKAAEDAANAAALEEKKYQQHEEQMMIEDDEENPSSPSHSTSATKSTGNIDFLTQFKRQKEKENAEKAAEQQEREKAAAEKQTHKNNNKKEKTANNKKSNTSAASSSSATSSSSVGAAELKLKEISSSHSIAPSSPSAVSSSSVDGGASKKVTIAPLNPFARK